VVGEAGGRRVGVGMDVRTTSPPIAGALVAGLRAAGIDVVRLGEVPTPLVYFAVHHLDLDGGVQVTGSHNPITFNGLKMMLGKGSFFGEDIQRLRERIAQREFAGGAGDETAHDVRGEYLDAVRSRVRLQRPLKVVVDAGNGCAWELAPRLLRELGCEVETLYCEPDGTFPNHIPDPTLPETLEVLRERVLSTGSDLGLAYDGDADRIGALDETGRVVWGDQLLALFAREVLATRPGAPILFEVKCSRGLVEDVEAHGGEPVMTRTGHSIIKTEMKRRGSPLAGEMSGHMFFADDWYGFDDALFASARLVSLLAAAGDSLAALVDSIPRYHATPELRIACPDDRKFDVVSAVIDRYRGSHSVIDVDGARIEFPEGWGLVRASNTQPVLVMRAEGRSGDARDAIERELRGVLIGLGVASAAHDA
jgi:phosphomannomutase/phosphoglucomutase